MRDQFRYLPQCSRTALEPQCPKSGQITPGLNPSYRISGYATVNNLYPVSYRCKVESWKTDKHDLKSDQVLGIIGWSVPDSGTIPAPLVSLPSSAENVGGRLRVGLLWKCGLRVCGATAQSLLPPPCPGPSEPRSSALRHHAVTCRV